jgi:transcription elongation factor Elf1
MTDKLAEQKRCPRCGQTKYFSEFIKDKNKKSGFSCCKLCKKKYRDEHKEELRLMFKEWRLNHIDQCRESSKKWRKENPEYYAQYRDKNKEQIRKVDNEWKGKNKEHRIKYNMEWIKKNPEKRREYAHKWRVNNPDKASAKYKKDSAKRRSTLKGKLNNTMSRSISMSLKKGIKAHRSWESLAGYTIDQLRVHLEKKFKSGMSWDNYGQWHIDHKIPLSVFNFETPEDIDFKKCWALSNLQPMWAKENIAKKNRLTKPFQPSLAIGIL